MTHPDAGPSLDYSAVLPKLGLSVNTEGGLERICSPHRHLQVTMADRNAEGFGI